MRDDLRSYFRLAVQQAEATWENDKSLHDLTWCKCHWMTPRRGELPGCLQHPRKPPDLSLLDAGQLFLVETVLQKNQSETIFGTRRTPPQRSVHMRVQPTQSIQHELHRFVWKLFLRFAWLKSKPWLAELWMFVFENVWPKSDMISIMIQWTWQNWMVGIFVAFGVQLLLVVIATIAFAKLCWAAWFAQSLQDVSPWWMPWK